MLESLIFEAANLNPFFNLNLTFSIKNIFLALFGTRVYLVFHLVNSCVKVDRICMLNE